MQILFCLQRQAGRLLSHIIFEYIYILKHKNIGNCLNVFGTFSTLRC